MCAQRRYRRERGPEWNCWKRCQVGRWEVGNHADNGGKHATKMHNEKTTRKLPIHATAGIGGMWRRSGKLPIRATAGIGGMGRRAGMAVGMLGRGREEIGQFESDIKEAIGGD